MQAGRIHRDDDKEDVVIQLESITKTYRLGSVNVDALKEVNLTIRRGEMVAIMGPSGSGKSTLMNLLGCLDKPTFGKYTLNGTDVGSLKDDALAKLRSKELGFVFQGFNLLPRSSALGNVELPLMYAGVGQRKANALEALTKVGLKERAKHKPPQMSGGEQQRVAIARALINKPSVILADEPTGNLDSHTSDEILKLFSTLNSENITIVLVTHEADIAQVTKRIIHVMDGRIVGDEPVLNRRKFSR